MPGIVRGPTHVVIELLGHLISALDNPALSKKQKALVMGAIGYIVTPIDLITANSLFLRFILVLIVFIMLVTLTRDITTINPYTNIFITFIVCSSF